MRASSISTDRAGIGAMVAFVLWVVTIALIYALMQGQAQSGALTGVVRVNGLRTVVLAGQSALAETSYVLRHPPDGGSNVLKGIEGGSASGQAHDPAATRLLYEDDVNAGRLTIEPIKYEVALKAPKPSDPWHIDLTVRVTNVFAGTKITRQLRRRVMGFVHEVKEIEGPKKGTVIFAALSIRGDPLFEVIEP